MPVSKLHGATVACPCCGYPTLTEPSAYEICPICWWEDDGQGDAQDDAVWGGSNGELSLTQARANFRDHLTIYRAGEDTRVGGPDAADEVATKRAMIAAYERLRSSPPAAERAAAWACITDAESTLAEELHRKIRAYEEQANDARAI